MHWSRTKLWNNKGNFTSQEPVTSNEGLVEVRLVHDVHHADGVSLNNKPSRFKWENELSWKLCLGEAWYNFGNARDWTSSILDHLRFILESTSWHIRFGSDIVQQRILPILHYKPKEALIIYWRTKLGKSKTHYSNRHSWYKQKPPTSQESITNSTSCKTLKLQVGSQIMLKVLPRKGMISFRKLGKLKPIYTGPCNISDRVGLVAVRHEPWLRTTGLHNHVLSFFFRLVTHNPIWKGIQPKDKRKLGKRTSRNHGLLGRTVEAESNSYRGSSLKFSTITIFSPIPF